MFAVTGVSVPIVVALVEGGIYEYELRVRLVMGTAPARGTEDIPIGE